MVKESTKKLLNKGIVEIINKKVLLTNTFMTMVKESINKNFVLKI
jgi:hypothetical protein